MVSSFRQGDILWMDFNPQAGHEQSGRRPALVVSCSKFNSTGALVMVCPITNTRTRLAIRPELPEGLGVTGCVLCDQAKFVDLSARNARLAAKAPAELTRSVLNILSALISPDEYLYYQ